MEPLRPVLQFPGVRGIRPGACPAVYPAHLGILLDPDDPGIARRAAADAIASNMLAAAKRSPVYALIKKWLLALPPHPEIRTLPMVWYVPPLSPVSQVEPGMESDAIDRLRIPVTYLANLLTAGDEAPVRKALKRLSALRRFKRTRRLENRSDTVLLDTVGLGVDDAEKMYRLLALARLQEVKSHGPFPYADVYRLSVFVPCRLWDRARLPLWHRPLRVERPIQ